VLQCVAEKILEYRRRVVLVDIVAVCCSILQCVLQCVVVYCSVLQCVVVCCPGRHSCSVL